MGNERRALNGAMRRVRGFSLLELVVIISIIGILAAYIAVRWKPVSTFTLGQQADVFTQKVRHVQSLASGWGLALRLVPAGTRYSVVCVSGTGVAPCVNPGDTVMDPATNAPFIVNLNDGVTISGFATEFDVAGRPVNGATLLTADRVFTLSVDGKTRVITVKPVTGFAVIS